MERWNENWLEPWRKDKRYEKVDSLGSTNMRNFYRFLYKLKDKFPELENLVYNPTKGGKDSSWYLKHECVIIYGEGCIKYIYPHSLITDLYGLYEETGLSLRKFTLEDFMRLFRFEGLDRIVKTDFSKDEYTCESGNKYYIASIFDKGGLRLQRSMREAANEKKIARVNGSFIKKVESKNVDGTIYGIFINNELKYIGKTIRDVAVRWNEHLACVKDRSIKNSQQNYLYEAMRNNKFEFKILKKESFKSNRELEDLEKKLIEALKPEYNYQGVKAPYRYSR